MQVLTHVVSALRNPDRLPVPYLMEKGLPLGTYVLDLELSYLLCVATGHNHVCYTSSMIASHCSYIFSC